MHRWLAQVLSDRGDTLQGETTTVVPGLKGSDRTRSNRCKLKECKSKLDIRKIFFYSESNETLTEVAEVFFV